eukprot:12366860-Alexandrium_andersonii.AAC.1
MGARMDHGFEGGKGALPQEARAPTERLREHRVATLCPDAGLIADLFSHGVPACCSCRYVCARTDAHC